MTYTSESSEAAVENAIKRIEKDYKTQAIGIRADLSDPASPKKIVDKTTEAFGDTIDILVNNAGVLDGVALKDVKIEDYDYHYNVNVRGVIFMTQAILPHLPKRAGRIINISSVGARIGVPNMSLYCSTKAALEGLTRCWADELGADGHTVNTVNPGAVQSDMLDKLPRDVIDAQKAVTSVEKRIGTKDDIAQIVAWLASEESRWISGQSLSATGGFAKY